MTARPIVLAPDPVLKTKAKPVPQVDDRVRALMQDMLDSMYEHQGVGLAANQIGVLDRVLVMDVAPKDTPPQPMKMANPEIVAKSDETAVNQEGCLSIPDHYADVERPARVTVRYLDENNEQKTLEADGWLAVCVQHEIDHLDGVLFVDHLSALKRNMILRKMTKLKRNQD
ncbi:peptide deformylase [Roseiterribacter gracilis]|uniref:Peptide deformylase n=1 Tax=Roseiterribacter gracilis TaxID=2812848 RepID=A0A8S8XFW7_9PROT|nr:peptide deformylase [Rhodospirillales bacterium TMPK1]